MVTQLKLDGQPINIYEIEHYITHMLSELNSKRNDGWVEEHYRKELSACSITISDYIQTLAEQYNNDDTRNWIVEYEKDKLLNLLTIISNNLEAN